VKSVLREKQERRWFCAPQDEQEQAKRARYGRPSASAIADPVLPIN
jgi:hypothetical protein